jgi:hypothetical protein
MALGYGMEHRELFLGRIDRRDVEEAQLPTQTTYVRGKIISHRAWNSNTKMLTINLDPLEAARSRTSATAMEIRFKGDWAEQVDTRLKEIDTSSDIVCLQVRGGDLVPCAPSKGDEENSFRKAALEFKKGVYLFTQEEDDQWDEDEVEWVHYRGEYVLMSD